MIYDLIAPFYDRINSDLNYSDWADFIEKITLSELGHKPEITLDLACGTGSMTIELAKRGYDMIGIDYSTEMLNVARERAETQGELGILWLLQDITEFELYGTVELVVSTLDCLNHLTEEADLKKCLSLVHNYLSPDGIFIFDINSKYKFENIYAENSYAMETENAFCVWQNYYDEECEVCNFYITLFEESDDGRYERYDEEQNERMYTLSKMRSLLENAGFEFVGAYGDFDFNVADENIDERIYIAARCKK